GQLRAVVVNAGNANCATGSHGLKAAKAVCVAAARLLRAEPSQIFPSSTGIIGVPLPYEKIEAALPNVFAAATDADDSIRRFAAAIMTTDTRPKVASTTVRIGGRDVRVLGMAKGSGMIHPNMATMLAYIFTDGSAPPGALGTTLRRAVDQSFNRI